MKAIEFLKQYKYLPTSVLSVPYHRPSNSEIRKWLNDGAVQINGVIPKPGDEIEFPIKELVFFSKSKRRTTIVLDDESSSLSITGEIRIIDGEKLYYPMRAE